MTHFEVVDTVAVGNVATFQDKSSWCYVSRFTTSTDVNTRTHSARMTCAACHMQRRWEHKLLFHAI